MYELIVKKKAVATLEKIQRGDKAAYQRIDEALLALEDNPRPQGAEMLNGALSGYRIRVGSYRILYTVEETVKIVVVYRVGSRGDVYKK